MKALFLQDREGKLLKNREKALYALILLFIISLFVPRAPFLTSVLLGLLVLFSFTYNSLKEKWALLRGRKLVWLLIGYYLLHGISTLFSINQVEASSQLMMRLPLLLFAIALGTISISYDLRNRILLGMAAILTIVAIVSMGLSMSQFSATGNSAYLYNDSLTVHFGQQSIYVAMLVNLSIVAFVYLLIKKPSFLTAPGLVYLCVFILLGYHFLLASRSAMILLYGGAICFAAYYIIRKRKYLEGFTLLLGLCIGAFMLFKFFPKTIQRFKELAVVNYQFNSTGAESHYDMKLSEDQWNGANTRLALWACGWELAQKKLLLGTGIGDRTDELNAVYREKNFTMALKTNKNVHNSYLDALLTFGIGGFLLYLLTFVMLPFARAFRSQDTFDIFLVTAFAVSMIFEVYLGRSIGSLITAFFFSFLAASELTQRKITADH
jgi:O-antigen ligase